jgi:tetratricopeptide (TPR) repeat protein
VPPSSRPPRDQAGRRSPRDGDPPTRPKGSRDVPREGETLPRWVVEGLTRVTAAERLGPALASLEEAADAFEAGEFDVAYERARRAKAMSSRDANVRELLGVIAYRLGDWDVALRELRTFRRLAGEAYHLPVELDCLRALGRLGEVDELWARAAAFDLDAPVRAESAIVYASALLDQSRFDDARSVVDGTDARGTGEYLRLGLSYVTARLAALSGAAEEARRIREAILEVDPSFPGIDELDALIAGSG